MAFSSQDVHSERYTLGRSAVLLGHAATRRLGLDRAKTVIEQVRDESGESVNLGVRDGREMVVVVSVESQAAPADIPGTRQPTASPRHQHG